MKTLEHEQCSEMLHNANLEIERLLAALESIKNKAGDYLDEDRDYEAEEFVFDVIDISETAIAKANREEGIT